MLSGICIGMSVSLVFCDYINITTKFSTWLICLLIFVSGALGLILKGFAQNTPDYADYADYVQIFSSAPILISLIYLLNHEF